MKNKKGTGMDLNSWHGRSAGADRHFSSVPVPFLFFIIVIIVAAATGSLLGVLPLDTSRPSTAEGRLQGEVDVFLGVESDDERGNIHHLLPNTDVPLPDENASMVNTLGESKLKHLSLEAPLQKVLNLQTEHVIKLHAGLIQHTDTHKTTQKGVSLKQSPVILLLESEQGSGSSPDLSQAVLDSPDLSLVPQTILANELQLLVEAGLLEGTPRSRVSFAGLQRATMVNHTDKIKPLGGPLVEVNQAILAWS